MTETTDPRPDVAPDAPITDEEREHTRRQVVRLLAAIVAVAIAAAIVFLASHHSGVDSRARFDRNGEGKQARR